MTIIKMLMNLCGEVYVLVVVDDKVVKVSNRERLKKFLRITVCVLAELC